MRKEKRKKIKMRERREGRNEEGRRRKKRGVDPRPEEGRRNFVGG
jgi:hypothetical protein